MSQLSGKPFGRTSTRRFSRSTTASNRAGAIEVRALVRRGEVPLLDERAPRLAERGFRAVLIALARRAAEDARDAGHLARRARERRLEPGGERVFVEAILLVLGGHLEEGIDLRLDRTLAEDVRAERVDRADAGGLELLERLIEPLLLEAALRVVLVLLLLRAGADARARALDLGAEAELHLAGGLLGEGHGDEIAFAARERRGAGPEEGEDALDERRRLPGARGRLDDERRAEVVCDALARLAVDELLAHFLFLSSARTLSGAWGFFFVRISSYGPHTGRKSHHVQAL